MSYKCHICVFYVTHKDGENMRNIIKNLTFVLLGASTFCFADSNYSSLYTFVENEIGINADEPNIIFSRNEVVSTTCSSNMIACFRTDKPGNIYIKSGLEQELVNVTLVGLMSDYLQFKKFKELNNNESCKIQTKYLLNTYKVRKAKEFRATECGRKILSYDQEILLASK